MQSWMPSRKLHHRHVEFGVRARGGVRGVDTVCAFMAHVSNILLLSPSTLMFSVLASWQCVWVPQRDGYNNGKLISFTQSIIS